MPVTINVVKTSSGRSYLTTTFGKLTSYEPILSMNSVENLHRVKEIFLDLGTSGVKITDKAVLVY